LNNENFICPACGAEVPAKAKACPECGSDEKTGWSANTVYDDTGIEDPQEFDYDDWKRRDLDTAKRRSRSEWFWLLVAATVIAVMLGLFAVWRWCAIE